MLILLAAAAWAGIVAADLRALAAHRPGSFVLLHDLGHLLFTEDVVPLGQAVEVIGIRLQHVKEHPGHSNGRREAACRPQH